LSADVERGRSGLGRRWGVRSTDRGDHDSPTSSLGHEAIRQPARTRRWSITTTRTHLVVGYKKPPHNGGGVAGLLRSSCGHLVRRHWHLARRARWLPGFAGPVPPPLWMSVGGIHLSAGRILRRARIVKETGTAGACSGTT